MKNERILCASIKIIINNEPIIISGYRHGDCFNILHKLKPDYCLNYTEEGFLTSSGRFVDRTEAKQLAKQANQLIKDSVFSELISENIY